MDTKLEVQLRYENGMLKFVDSIKEGYDLIKSDPKIWKISWGFIGDVTDKFSRRFVRKTKQELWNPFSEKKMCELSSEYNNASIDSKEIFWIQQNVFPTEEWINVKSLEYSNLRFTDPETYENIYYSYLIQEVLTEKQFVEKYCM